MIVNNIDDIKLGSSQVEKVCNGSHEIWSDAVYYGGLKCFMDNVKLKGNYNKSLTEEIIKDKTSFLFMLDTGTTGDKNLRIGNSPSRGEIYMYMEGFDENPASGAKSVDSRYVYTSMSSGWVKGRYLVFSLKHDYARYFAVVNSSTGKVLVKGEDAVV